MTDNFGSYSLPASRLKNLWVSTSMSVKSFQDRKEYIANIASTIFCKKGYKTASLQDIAKKGNLSKAGIFHYFKTKEDILSYILIRNSDNFIAILKSCIKENGERNFDREMSLRNLINTYATHVNKWKEGRLLTLQERHQLTGKNKKALLKKERMLFHLIKDELKKVKQIDKRYNLNVVSFLIIAMSHWLGYWLDEDGELSQEQAISQNIDIVFRGIFGN